MQRALERLVLLHSSVRLCLGRPKCWEDDLGRVCLLNDLRMVCVFSIVYQEILVYNIFLEISRRVYLGLKHVCSNSETHRSKAPMPVIVIEGIGVLAGPARAAAVRTRLARPPGVCVHTQAPTHWNACRACAQAGRARCPEFKQFQAISLQNAILNQVPVCWCVCAPFVSTD